MYKCIKFLLDIFFGIIGFLFLLPIFSIVAIAIKIDSKGPVMFKQERVGKDGKIFKMYKFRSMKSTDVVFHKETPVISDDNENVTRVGRIIRKFKIDEAIQLLNIIKGDMSFIGPRPLRQDYLEDYSEWEKTKFKVRPGLGGLAQTKGNGYINIKERNYYDKYYVEHLGFCLDCNIFFKTLIVTFVGEEKFIKNVDPKIIQELEANEGKTYNPDDYKDLVCPNK